MMSCRSEVWGAVVHVVSAALPERKVAGLIPTISDSRIHTVSPCTDQQSLPVWPPTLNINLGLYLLSILYRALLRIQSHLRKLLTHALAFEPSGHNCKFFFQFFRAPV